MTTSDDDLRITATGQDARDLLAALMATQPPTGDDTATMPATSTEIDAGRYWTIELPDDLSLLTERAPSGFAAYWPTLTDCHPGIDPPTHPPMEGWTRYKLIITGEKWGDDE